VATVARLSTSDLDGALGLVREAAAADGDQPFKLPLIERLTALVPADRGGYVEYRLPGRIGADLYRVVLPGWPMPRWESEEVAAAVPFWDVSDTNYRTRHVVRSGDGMTRAQKSRNPWQATVERPMGIAHEMRFWLAGPPGWVRGFFFIRNQGRRNFSERDRNVLTILRPHLGAIRERWQRKHHPAGLTAREIEVLRLIRQGLTNREIADRLVISPGTVRTHLENVFEKLGVHTRTAALARAFDAAD